MLIIHNINKPKNCYNCPFNESDIWCNVDREHITIDRDNYSPMGNKCPLSEIPDNATNGDVIKELFPNTKYAECKNVIAMHTEYFGVTHFDKDWWNAPYGAESEDKE